MILFSDVNDYLEWICGFANAQGGRIYIGCDDNGHIIGLDNTRKLLEDIPNKVRNAMSIVVDVNRLEENGKEYIEIVVPPYPVAISCKGVYYYRSGSTMQTLSGPELESFILRKRGASWDNMPLPGFTIDDIDDALVQKFKTLAAKKGRIDESVLSESKADLMEKLRLTNAGHYTNAAMLLFSKDPLLLMYIIWLASLKAGDAVSKKFVRLAKRTAHHYRNTQFILAIL